MNWTCRTSISSPGTPVATANRRARAVTAQASRVLATGVALGWLGAGWVDAVMWLVAALLAYTLVNRVRQGLKEQQETSPIA